MYALIDWQTKALVCDAETYCIRLFATEHKACSFARENLQQGLWSVIPVPEDAMFFID